MKIGTVIEVKYKLDNKIILINKNVIDIKNLVLLFEEEYQIKRSTLNFNDNVSDVWTNRESIDRREYGNKFIFWLKKNGWKEVTSMIKEINIL